MENYAIAYCMNEMYHCYSIRPIDMWHSAVPLPQYLAGIRSDHNGDTKNADKEIACIMEALEIGQETCRQELDWNGDMIIGVHVSGLPDSWSHELAPVFMWKQESNGTTFVVSPMELPWLKDTDSMSIVAAG